ncbi:site-specific integrase [Rhizobium ruizarguesonis]|uniref:tyrosine-type recombinase/integrase n=1 Tax=Rhizobium ruizarguesonis TaxID=2081791 RepID=UPI001030E693|nr:site-specific integrase [Rhizobium ruizarguesonis]TAW23101.1 site-specific integrase [Rhizobium ruizarguesonis]
MATVRKRLLPSGKQVWQADYRDGAGKRRSKQFTLKKEADAFLVSARGEVAKGVHVAESASITVEAAAKAWIKRAESQGLERSTIASYQQHVDLHIVPRIGATKLSKMTVPNVHDFADELGRDLSRAMVKKVLGSLSGIFTEALRTGKAAQNPVAAVKIKTSKRDAARAEMPTKAELRAILNATPEKHKPFIWTAAFTGLRASELRGLPWSDVDLDGKILHVRQRADPYNVIGKPKSEAGTRDVPLAPSVVATLKTWKEKCPKGDLDLVFPNGAGNVESHANLLNRVFWPIQVAACVSVKTDKVEKDGQPVMDAKYSLHALRHAAAALWIEQNATPKRIQMLMGHSSIQMTYDTYGYLFDAREDDQAAITAIEERLLAS